MEQALLLNAIVSVTAIVAPIIGTTIGTIIQTQNAKKLQAQSFVADHKMKSIEDYIENVGRYLFNQGTTEYTVVKGMSIFMYTPKHLHAKIQALNDLILQIQNADGYENTSRLKSEARIIYIDLCRDFACITSHKNWHTRI